MSEPVLAISGLRRVYATGQGPLEVLKGADLTVAAGEIVGLVGPSGSGKSSLLHAAGLLEHPTAGKIVIDGHDCGGMDDRTRTLIRLNTIGFVYQFHHLLPEFSALDNVALPALIAGRSRRDARARAETLLAQVGLSARLDHQPAQLSGGEQQRLRWRGPDQRSAPPVGRRTDREPDPTTSESVFARLRDLVRATGVAALIATHNLEMTRHMDRVLTMRDGSVVERQTP